MSSRGPKTSRRGYEGPGEVLIDVCDGIGVVDRGSWRSGQLLVKICDHAVRLVASVRGVMQRCEFNHNSHELLERRSVG